MDDSISPMALEEEQLIPSLRAKVNLLETQLKEREAMYRLDSDSLRSQLSSSQTEAENKSIEIYELKTTCAELKTEKERYLSDQRIREIQWKEQLKAKEREIIDLQDRPNAPLNLPLDTHSQVSFLTQRVLDLRFKYAKASALAQEFQEQLRRLVTELEAKSPELLHHQQRFADLSGIYTALKSRTIDLVATEATQAQLIEELRTEIAQDLIEKETVTKDCEELAGQVQTLLYEVELLQSIRDERKPASFLDVQEMQKENISLKRSLRHLKALGSAELLLDAKAEVMEKQYRIEKLERQIEAIQSSEPVSSPLQMDSSYGETKPQKDPRECFQCASLNQRCATLQSELNSKKVTEASMQIGLREHQETISKLRIENLVFEEKISHFAADNASLSSQLEASIQRERTIQCDNRNLRAQFDALLSSHQKASKLLKELEATHITDMRQTTEEKDELYGKVKALEQEIEKVKSAWISAGIESHSDLENMRLEISSLTTQLTASEPVLELNAAKTEIARLKAVINDLTESQQHMIRADSARCAQNLVVEATHSQATFTRLREKLTMAISDSESRAAETLILYTELHDLKLELQVSKTRIFDLEIALRKRQEETFHRIEELKSDLEREKAQFEAEFQFERENLASTQGAQEVEFRALQDKISFLEAELQTVSEAKSVLEQELSNEKRARETAQTTLLLHSEAQHSACTKTALTKLTGVLLRYKKIT